MALSYFFILALAFAAVQARSPCVEINSRFPDTNGAVNKMECENLGCLYDGRCKEPKECSMEEVIRYQGENTGMKVLRSPMGADRSNLCAASPECTAIYEVTLQQKFSSGPPNCNDIGMLPAHGRDMRECEKIAPKLYSANSQKDFTSHPFPDDVVKQNSAARKNSHTALEEETKECWKDDHCAFPLGFMSDAILKSKAVCVRVKGVQDKWVEIMASSRQGSDGGSFCVKDWGKESEQACTKEGDLYQCRESGNANFGTNNFEDEMRIMFFAQDNIDDAHMNIHWRIAASNLPKINNEEKDAEDWCQYRDASDYPLSLAGAYPFGFDGNPVFDKAEDSASTVTSCLFVTVAAALAAYLF